MGDLSPFHASQIHQQTKSLRSSLSYCIKGNYNHSPCGNGTRVPAILQGNLSNPTKFVSINTLYTLSEKEDLPHFSFWHLFLAANADATVASDIDGLFCCLKLAGFMFVGIHKWPVSNKIRLPCLLITHH